MSLKNYIILSALACLACACNNRIDALQAPIEADVEILPRITGFGKDVTDSKATSKNTEESLISNMMMYVFDSNGNLAENSQASIDNHTAVDNPQFQQVTSGQSGDVIFNIIRQNFKDEQQAALAAAEVVILANIPSARVDEFKAVTSLSALEGKDFAVSGIGIPTEGFPMIGAKTMNLQKGTGGATGTQRVSIAALYSKIAFNITVNPDQVNPEVTQRFQLSEWTVHNIPTKVRIGKPDNNAETAYASGAMLEDIKKSNYSGINPVPSGAGTLSFSFYMPEHKVNPANTAPAGGYPAGISDYDKQRFKADLCSDTQKPAYVEVTGFYYDHNDRKHDVTYSIYLGVNNIDNFYINRDCIYYNNINIKGISNSKYDGSSTISYDGRVDVEKRDFKFELERETLLDSHWEIRPIRITLDASEHPDGRIEIEILNHSTSNWLRLEMPDNTALSDTDAYCDATSMELSYGKRRYFTTDLVTSTLADGTSCSFTATPQYPGKTVTNVNEHTIWMYIDEFVQPGGPETRTATIRCKYYDNDVLQVTEDYNFIQRNVYPVSYGGRNYNIEYYEEYLYNFDSRDPMTTLPDGMAWGLEDKQLSFESNAIAVDGVLSDDAATAKVRSVFPYAYYDFYNTFEEATQGRLDYYPYQGKRFTRKISSKMNFAPMATDKNSQSAVEYCLNKNKRGSDGKISKINWYLPAIDEIEDICMGAYTDFEVFQNKYYWSSQPAYKVDSLSYTFFLTTNYGNFYEDNVKYARATKVESAGGSFSTVKSGASGSETLYSFNYFSNDYSPTSTGKISKFQEGYKSRTTVENRIRCAYQKPDQIYSSNIGFETSSHEGLFVPLNGIERKNNSGNSHSPGSWYAETKGQKETLVLKTCFKIDKPKTISFWVYKTSGSDAGNWYVDYSSDGESWTNVGSAYNSNVSEWTRYECDLSSISSAAYIRIRHTFNNKSGWFPSYTEKRIIDDIELTYEY